MFDEAHKTMDLLVPTIKENNRKGVENILGIKPILDKMQLEFVHRKSERLGIDTPDAEKIARIEVSATDKLLRI